jgi:hypothetical protein
MLVESENGSMATSAKARLDADGKATPKTRIIKHVKQGDCVGPQTHSDSLEFREGETKIPLKPKPLVKEDKSRHIQDYTIVCTRWSRFDWTASHPGYSIVGKGETADGSIQDWRDKYNKRFP